MTVELLRAFLNTEYGLHAWPRSFEVDHETYANVCDFIFKDKIKGADFEVIEGYNEFWYAVALGEHGGIMFKNVELILKRG